MIGLGLGLGIGTRGGGATVWSPSSLPNKVAWFRADLGTNTTTNGGTITSWADQFGLQAAFVNAVGTTTYTSSSPVNSRPAITFPGTSRLDSATSASWGLTSHYELWWIGRITTGTTFNCLISKGVSTGWDNYITGNTITTVHTGISAASSSDAARIAAGVNLALRITEDGTNVAWSAQGASEGSSVLGPPNSNATAVSVGQRGDGATTLTGHICEIIATSAVLAGADLASLKTYLNTRYGFTL